MVESPSMKINSKAIPKEIFTQKIETSQVRLELKGTSSLQSSSSGCFNIFQTVWNSVRNFFLYILSFCWKSEKNVEADDVKFLPDLEKALKPCYPYITQEDLAKLDRKDILKKFIMRELPCTSQKMNDDFKVWADEVAPLFGMKEMLEKSFVGGEIIPENPYKQAFEKSEFAKSFELGPFFDIQGESLYSALALFLSYYRPGELYTGKVVHDQIGINLENPGDYFAALNALSKRCRIPIGVVLDENMKVIKGPTYDDLDVPQFSILITEKGCAPLFRKKI